MKCLRFRVSNVHLSGRNVVTHSPKLHYDQEGEVLVGVKTRHGSGTFVGVNLLFDFEPVRSHVGPGSGEVVGSKSRI